MQNELQLAVKEFFNKYLNVVEESDGGRLFNPTTIGCCRAMQVEPLGQLLEKMRVLSGANKNPLEEMNNADNK
jgi:3'-phosphoadenosine 5'-phosphosulfate sulfotransferase (PAPS reductase)/FAD synthetase